MASEVAYLEHASIESGNESESSKKRNDNGLNEVERRQFSDVSVAAEKRLQEAIAVVQEFDWNSAAIPEHYVMISPTCHLVENCVVKFRQFVKEKGLFFVKQKAILKDDNSKKGRKGGFYYMCVATSVQLAKLKIAEQLHLNNDDGTSLDDGQYIVDSNINILEDVPTNISSKKRKAEDKPSREKKERSPSAFLLFSNDFRAKIAADNPSASFGELSRLIGHSWSTLDNSGKDYYHKLSEIKRFEFLAKQVSSDMLVSNNNHNEIV